MDTKIHVLFNKAIYVMVVVLLLFLVTAGMLTAWDSACALGITWQTFSIGFIAIMDILILLIAFRLWPMVFRKG